jgi:hypothetical protein
MGTAETILFIHHLFILMPIKCKICYHMDITAFETVLDSLQYTHSIIFTTYMHL